MDSAVTSILAVFTAVLEWFATAMSTISSVFYVPDTGLTFIGIITVITLAIAVVLLVVAMIRSFLKGRG